MSVNIYIQHAPQAIVHSMYVKQTSINLNVDPHVLYYANLFHNYTTDARIKCITSASITFNTSVTRTYKKVKKALKYGLLGMVKYQSHRNSSSSKCSFKAISEYVRIQLTKLSPLSTT